MKKSFILILSIIFMYSCKSGSDANKKETADSVSVKKSDMPMNMEEKEMKEMAEKQKNEKPKESPYKNSKIDVTTSKNKDGSWGYSIAIDGRTYIVQPNIPPLPGTRGFNTTDEAKKTGEFVAYKIRNNIMPPSLTVEELDSLGTLK
ncbi:MAG: DUF4907 domain-containing protein [Bacteroidetes bacterium]|nr:DUF4907 domain-containing protein [Bacteroidota bacterium]